MKMQIEEEINADFANVYYGIKQFPVKASFGIYVAYKYYLSLFKKIKQTQPAHILQQQIRIANYSSAFIVMRTGGKNQLI